MGKCEHYIDQQLLCEGKVAFESAALALKVLRSRRGHIPRQCYKCPHCHKFHLGSSIGKEGGLREQR